MGIDLSNASPREVFKWFLAAVLFGARISESVAVRTYREFEKDGLLTARKIVALGWDDLVSVLDRGGYVRYDFKTATKLLEVNRGLLDNILAEKAMLSGDPASAEELAERAANALEGTGGMVESLNLQLLAQWCRRRSKSAG